MTEENTLFERLLALDHSRQPPWGPLHGAATACFWLQHAPAAVRADDPLVAILQAYLGGGEAALGRFTAGARRRGGHPPATGPLLPGPPARFAVTIVDVAVDGTFPAAGHAGRVRAWAAATLSAWGVGPVRDPSPDRST